MAKDSSAAFLAMLQAETEALAGKLATKDGGWIVKGFIDVFRNVYTISDDTKVISKLIEIMLFPALAEFASREGLKLVPAAEQNHYPDISFIDKDGFRYAVDFKTTYRTNTTSVNTMTLGAFTGYFRERESTKNITFPYSSYKGHFVLGVIYSRAEARANELKKFGIDELTNIPSVVRDFDFFAQPKFKIAKDLPGSGNTKNIGSVNDLAALKSGGGPFASLGEAVFDDYWMHYLTADMALAAELAAPPYRDIASYFAFKRIPDTSGEHK